MIYLSFIRLCDLKKPLIFGLFCLSNASAQQNREQMAGNNALTQPMNTQKRNANK